MSVPLPHLRAAIVATPWAILPARLEAIFEVVERRCAGIRLSKEEIAAIKGERAPNGTIVALEAVEPVMPDLLGYSSAARSSAAEPQRKQVAVINLRGIVSQHASNVDDISGAGGVSTERLNQALAQADADPNIVAVLLRIDSPGGSVYGVQETADRIYAMRNTTPVHGSIDSQSASAAYWLAAQCSTLAITNSGEAGGIGVYCVHQDVSAAADKAGVRFTYVSAGKHKVDGNPHQPLSDDALENLQASVDSYYADFLKAVARGRGRPLAQVRDGFGQGRVMRAVDSVKAGLCDRVETFEQTLKRLTSGVRPAQQTQAADPSGMAFLGHSETEPLQAASGLQIALQPLRSFSAQSQEQLGQMFSEAVASAQEAARAAVAEQMAAMWGTPEQLSALVARLDDLQAALAATGQPRRVVVSEAHSESEPRADTSPPMKICPDCGCNMEAASTRVYPQAGATGMGEGDMPIEDPQSSSMEKCPDCGQMREPPAARDGTDGGNGAEAPKVDPEAVARFEMRKRRHAQRQAARGLYDAA